MNQQYSILISKIEIFIRKYYKNQLIKGIILSLSLIITFFLLAISLEHFIQFNTTIRGIIFYLYIFSASIIFIHYIIRPIAGIIKIGKRLSKEQAAEIIGTHFSDINDKLLNTLQLHSNLEEKSNQENTILKLAIEQKSQELSPIPFQTAINFSINKKYLKYVIPPVVIILLLAIYSPETIIEPSNRLIKHDTKFIKKAPFEFIISNENLDCLYGEDFLLNAKITGSTIPEDVFIVIDNYPFKVNRKSNIEINYLFKKLTSTKSFYFKAGKFRSVDYSINVNPSPKIISFAMKIDFPKYLNKKSEIIKNAGDISIPEGSYIQWIFNTKDITKLSILLPKYNYELYPENNSIKSKSIRFVDNFKYSLHAQNDFSKNSDTLHYNVEVIKDQYPRIKIITNKDSLDDKMIYFQGEILDDYGFSSLVFKWKTTNNSSNQYKIRKINFNETNTSQRFYYYINIDSLQVKAGETINYFFEVKDNDGVNGSKAATSIMQAIHKKSFNEIDSLRNENNDELKTKMEESIEQAQEINKKVEKLNKELVDKKNLDWKDKKQLKELVDEYKKMLENIEEIKEKQEKTSQQNKELTKEDERLLEKQKKLQELFEKLMTPEMKEMLKEMQKMVEDEMKKEDAQEMLKKMESDNKDLEKELDRNLELFKQMEFDQKLQEAINKLDSLQKKQEELSNENKLSNEESKKEQEKLNKEFEDFKKKLDEAKKSNEELEKPNEMKDMEQEKNDIQKKMEESSEKLEDKKKNSASKMQKSASESMKKMSDKLKEMQSEMESESNAENMEDIKDILNNLIEVSFAQEQLMEKTQIINKNDPKYPAIISEQKKLNEDFKMIEDSLISLSKRQASISPMVNKELSNINRDMKTSLDLLLDMNTIGYAGRNTKKVAIGKQQSIMTSVNNLALMLSESLEQMQKQQQQKNGSGKGSCKKPKPGSSGSSMKSIRQMQQALNKQMKRMQEELKKGKGQKGKKKGEGQQGSGGEKMSEEMARMAAQQEMLRKRLQTKQNELKKAGRGKEAQGLNKAIKDMEQNETELVNSMILRESMIRQQEIVTRLLEAEKAEREQKQEETREAKSGEDRKHKNPPQLEKFLEQQNKEVELLKTIPPNMKPFYKNKVNQYFESINQMRTE